MLCTNKPKFCRYLFLTALRHCLLLEKKDRSIEITSMDFHEVNCMNKCNVRKKKILVISNNKCSLTLVIALFTVVILFIRRARKSRLYFAACEKKTLIC